MKNNNLIQEEINRAKQLWGYDTSKTIFEQATGTSNTCYAITTLTPCSGGTYGGYAQSCFSVNGVPGDPSEHVGKVIQGPYGMIGTIQNTAPIPTTSWTLQFTQTTCPNTNTGNTGTTGTTGTTCMGMISQGCPGTPQANLTMTTPNNKCATIDNIPVTANDVGRDIMAPMGGPHMTVQSVFSNPNGNGSDNVTSAQGPCPRPNTSTGTTTGTTTTKPFPNNFNPSSWFSTFLSNAQAKPWYVSNKCQFFANRIQHWTNKLQGAGPLKQNMLNAKINEVTSYARQSTPGNVQPNPRCTNI